MGLARAGRIGITKAAYADARLTTARLDLRPIDPADMSSLAAHLSDPEVSRWLARVPHPYTLSDARVFIDHVRLAAVAGSAVTFGIVVRADGEDTLSGVVAIHGLEGVPEFGYWLAKTKWGRGLMTEAVGASLSWIVNTLRPGEILSGAYVGNEASLAIQRRFGFHVTGESRRQCLARGEAVPHIDTVLTPGAFEVAIGGGRP